MKLFRCITCREEKPLMAEFIHRMRSRPRGQCSACENAAVADRRYREKFGQKARKPEELTPEGAKRRAAALRRTTVRKRAAKAQELLK